MILICTSGEEKQNEYYLWGVNVFFFIQIFGLMWQGLNLLWNIAE